MKTAAANVWKGNKPDLFMHTIVIKANTHDRPYMCSCAICAPAKRSRLGIPATPPTIDSGLENKLLNRHHIHISETAWAACSMWCVSYFASYLNIIITKYMYTWRDSVCNWISHAPTHIMGGFVCRLHGIGNGSWASSKTKYWNPLKLLKTELCVIRHRPIRYGHIQMLFLCFGINPICVTAHAQPRPQTHTNTRHTVYPINYTFLVMQAMQAWIIVEMTAILTRKTQPHTRSQRTSIGKYEPCAAACSFVSLHIVRLAYAHIMDTKANLDAFASSD